MIASHNTMSYNKPRKWWMKPFKFMACCQDITLEEQYMSGTRVFDFRIRKKKNYEQYYFAHGFVEYESDDPFTVISDFIILHNDVSFELVAEDTFTSNYDYEAFNDFVNRLKTSFPNTNIVKVYKKGWKQEGTFGYKDQEHNYYTWSLKPSMIIPYPYNYYVCVGQYLPTDDPDTLYWCDFV